MIIRFLSIFLFVNIPLFLHSQGAIDGYMKSKKETDIALTYSYESFDKYWFGSELQNQSLTTQSASLFVAHGFRDDFNLILSLPYMHIDEENKNIQDAILAVKFRNKKTDFNSGSLNKITAVGFSFPASGYDADTENPIGQRAVAFMLRHLYQWQSNSGFFAHLQSGFDFRLIPDTQFAVPLIFRTGYAHSKFYFDVWLDYFHTMEPGVDQTISAGTGSRYLKIGGTFYYPVMKRLGVFVGGAQYLSGRNIGKASRVNVGIVLKRMYNPFKATNPQYR